MHMDKIQTLKMMIDSSQKIVFFTGAGISVPSGIPDFRSADGLYTNDMRAEEIISHSYFMHDPSGFYRFYKEKMCFPKAEPNTAHLWISELEKKGKSLGVITQNIDGLHNKAGSVNVAEIHGSIHRNHCMRCHRFYSLDDILKSEDVPMCRCGGIIKPDVVLYEEALDQNTVYQAIKMINEADCLIIIGTSLVVYPAASYIDYFNGEKLALINKGNSASVKGALVIDDDIINVVKELNK